MSLHFPISFKQPFAVGTKHIKEGVSSIKEGKWSGGIFEAFVGALEMVPLINYGILSIEKQITLRTVDQKMNARREELHQEIQSDGVILQQLFFETHNSKVKGKLAKTSPIYKTLEYSLPDRQLKILISQLEDFSSKLDNTENKEKITELIQILNKAEPLACIISCLMQEKKESNRILLLNKFKELVLKQFKELKTGEKLIIPYGFLNKDIHDLASKDPMGHMTLLEITKTDDKTAQLRLFNSGVRVEKEHQLVEDAAFPWKRTVSFEEIANDTFWQSALDLLHQDQKPDMSNAYDKLKKLEEAPAVRPTEENLKSYRIQTINHCPKKSLQIWLHDMMKDNPVLYQKFRIFNLDNLHQKATQIISSSSNKRKITIDHAIALWGGSDRVNDTFDNLYYKFRGFFSGPRVRQELPLVEVQKMVDYDTVVNLSRNCRLKILENDLMSAIDDVLKSDLNIVHKVTLLQGLQAFCEKRKIECDPSLFILPRNELEQFLHEPQLEQKFLELYQLKSIGLDNTSLFINFLITVIGVDETISQVTKFYTNDDDQFEAFLSIYSICLRKQDQASMKKLNPKLYGKSLPLNQSIQLAKTLNPYYPEAAHKILETALDFLKKRAFNFETLQLIGSVILIYASTDLEKAKKIIDEQPDVNQYFLFIQLIEGSKDNDKRQIINDLLPKIHLLMKKYPDQLNYLLSRLSNTLYEYAPSDAKQFVEDAIAFAKNNDIQLQSIAQTIAKFDYNKALEITNMIQDAKQKTIALEEIEKAHNEEK